MIEFGGRTTFSLHLSSPLDSVLLRSTSRPNPEAPARLYHSWIFHVHLQLKKKKRKIEERQRCSNQTFPQETSCIFSFVFFPGIFFSPLPRQLGEMEAVNFQEPSGISRELSNETRISRVFASYSRAVSYHKLRVRLSVEGGVGVACVEVCHSAYTCLDA